MPPARGDAASRLLLVGLVLVAAQLTLRGWAVLGGWFYSDDLEFLADATGTPLGPGFLMTPHDSQLMPGGILVTWVVARAGAYAWTAAAVSVLAMQLVADLACWWALRQLFGARWQVLPLLAAYLFWPLTFTSVTWWAAALNHVPLQAAAFLAVGSLVRHLRTGRRRWAVATVGAVVLGLCFYVKAVLLPLPLALLALLYFTDWSLGPRRALTGLLRRVRLLALVLGATVVGYLVLYVTTVPSPLTGTAEVEYGAVADAMFRRSLAPVLLGGPWRWSTVTPPISLVGTPEVLATAALGGLVAGLAIVLVRRRGAWRALALVLPYLALAFWLTARGRGPGVADVPGLLLRYLADSTPWLVVAAGLLLLPLLGDRSPGAASTAVGDGARGPRVRLVLVAVAATVLGGSVWSSVSFATPWRDFAARTFVQNVAAASEERPLVVLDEPVPREVADVTAYENTLPSTLLRPLAPRVRAVEAATDPVLLDATGVPSVPVVDGGVGSAPGPQQDCGYPVGDVAVPVPTTGSPTTYDWWVQVAYFAGEPTVLSMRLGDRTMRVPVERGAHRWFAQGSGDPGEVVLEGTEAGRVVCVTSVDVGSVVPFGPA